MNIYPSTFTAIDRTPFTYCITHKITKKKYYGCRFAKGCKPEDLWTIYFTSSKIIKNIIDNEGKDIFDIKICRIFDSKKKCVEHESKFLYRVKAINNDSWYNLHVGSKSFRSSVGTIWINNGDCQKQILPIDFSKFENLGFKKGMISNKKDQIHIYNSLTGNRKMINIKELSSYELKGYIKGSPEKVFQTLRKNAKENIGKIWVNNGSEEILISKNDLEKYLKSGYSKGMMYKMSDDLKKEKSNLWKDTIFIKNLKLKQEIRIKKCDWLKYKNLGWIRGIIKSKTIGKIWITNLIIKDVKRIFPVDFILYNQMGYIKGHLLSNTRDYMWISNVEKNISKTIKKEEWEKYKVAGYIKGRANLNK